MAATQLSALRHADARWGRLEVQSERQNGPLMRLKWHTEVRTHTHIYILYIYMDTLLVATLLGTWYLQGVRRLKLETYAGFSSVATLVQSPSVSLPVIGRTKVKLVALKLLFTVDMFSRTHHTDALKKRATLCSCPNIVVSTHTSPPASNVTARLGRCALASWHVSPACHMASAEE